MNPLYTLLPKSFSINSELLKKEQGVQVSDTTKMSNDIAAHAQKIILSI